MRKCILKADVKIEDIAQLYIKTFTVNQYMYTIQCRISECFAEIVWMVGMFWALTVTLKNITTLNSSERDNHLEILGQRRKVYLTV